MKKNGLFKHLDFAILELLSLVVSFFIVLIFRNQLNILPLSNSYMTLLVFEVLVNMAVTSFYDPFKDILKRNRIGLLSYTLIYDFLQLMFVVLLLFVIKISSDVSRLYLAHEYILYFFVSMFFKFLLRMHLNKYAKKSINKGNKTLLIVTVKSNIKGVIKDIHTNNFDGNRILGLCILDDDSLDKYEDIEVVCKKDDLLTYAANNWVDGVYFDLPLSKIPKNIIDSLSYAGITTYIELKDLINTGYDTHINNVLGNSVLSISVKERTNKQIILKELMDLIGGVIGSLITILLTLIIGPIIKIKSPNGPIFYKQERIGLNGRHFYMYKFRSMIHDAEKHLEELKNNNRVSSDLMFKMENDPRIIPGIGNFIRKSSIDEFPQFFNVLKGDMSLVGTRPPTVDEWNKYELKHRIRMSTKPGITGMWQTSGRNNITDFDEVVKLDAKYIAEWSLGLDIKLILLTVIKLFKKSKDEAM